MLCCKALVVVLARSYLLHWLLGVRRYCTCTGGLGVDGMWMWMEGIALVREKYLEAK